MHSFVSKGLPALIITDIQNDFLPGGALPVAQGDEIIPVINRLQQYFHLIVATQDWHPPDHGSFAVNHPGRRLYEVIDLYGIEQILWPVHCVQGSEGASFAETLDMSRVRKIFQKGTDPRTDSYSAFFDNGHRNDTGLGAFLTQESIQRVYFVGLATDYCVKYSTLDARALGFETFVIEDGCRGVNRNFDDETLALEEMRLNGIKIIKSADVEKSAKHICSK